MSASKFLAGLHTNSYLTIAEVTIAWLIYKQKAKERVFFFAGWPFLEVAWNP
jgi:hypothetical protein